MNFIELLLQPEDIVANAFQSTIRIGNILFYLKFKKLYCWSYICDTFCKCFKYKGSTLSRFQRESVHLCEAIRIYGFCLQEFKLGYCGNISHETVSIGYTFKVFKYSISDFMFVGVSMFILNEFVTEELSTEVSYIFQ